MAARTDTGVARNTENKSIMGTIQVSMGAGGCLLRSTSITSSVGSATESVEAISRSAAEISPSISLALTEALRRPW